MPPDRAAAATSEPTTDPQIDPAPCVAAAASDDADRIIAVCGALIDNEKTLRPDRAKALIARARAYDRTDQIDRAISDYDTALRFDPTLSDVFNARGELWRQLQVAGAGAGAARRADGHQEQAGCALKPKSALEMMPLPVTMADE
jgi:tetratricopeptide (TPR) repeat protein